MSLNSVLVGDIETIGFLEKVSKKEDLHVFSCAYKSGGSWKIKSTKDKEKIQSVIGNVNNIIVFHNGISFDKPALEKMGWEFNAQLIDTLPLSYYIYNERDKHGLADWGEFFGVPKPKIEDWENLSYEEYKNRCEEDVKINTNLWIKLLSYLRNLYDSDEEIFRIIKYLNHKANCLYIQDQNPILIDVPRCKENLKYLESVVEKKTKELESIMPKVPEKTIKKPPKQKTKKCGSMTSMYIKWLEFLKSTGLPEDHNEEVEYIKSYKEPSGTSNIQIKNFLFSLGWQPKIFKDGANGKVPQLRDDDKNLCKSIKKLIEYFPKLESLDGLSVAMHRAGYLKGFLEKCDENGYCKSWAHGFTRTLRLKHVKPFVNLPKPNADYGELIRGVMIAPEGYVCIGADLSSIEDKCKQISINYLDPNYVKSMDTVGWDAHLALGLTAGMFTKDEVQFYKWFKSKDKEVVIGECPQSFLRLSDEEKKESFESLDKKRAVAKTGTYSLTYGAGAPKVAESAEIPLKEAKALHKGYWVLNWSVKKFAKDRTVKKVKGHNWLRKNKKAGGIKEVNELNWIWNEYSKMWLFLKNDKDRFSACNQNFGVKIFDVWAWILIEEGINPCYQSHDELMWYCKEDEVKKHTEVLNRSVIRLNKIFNAPVSIEIDYKIGNTYAEIH